MNTRARVVAALCALLCAGAVAGQPVDPLARPRKPRPEAVNVRNADEEIREMIEGSAQVSFDYEEDIMGEPAEKPKGGGGIAGKINEVAELISADQGKTDTTSSARLRLRLIPVLRQQGDVFTVTLRVEQTHYAVGGELPPESRADVDADRADAVARLAKWQRVLTPEQVVTLKETGSLTLGVRQPFAGKRLRSRDQPVVTVYLLEDAEAEVVDVKFLVRTKSGVKRMDKLIWGCVTVAEVTLDRAPSTDEPITVRIASERRTIELTGTPTAKDSTTLRTEPFVPVLPQDIEGLDPPSIPTREDDVRVGIP